MGPASEWDTAEEHLELRLRRFGIPVALAVAWVLVKPDLGHFMLRTFWRLGRVLAFGAAAS